MSFVFFLFACSVSFLIFMFSLITACSQPQCCWWFPTAMIWSKWVVYSETVITKDNSEFLLGFSDFFFFLISLSSVSNCSTELLWVLLRLVPRGVSVKVTKPFNDAGASWTRECELGGPGMVRNWKEIQEKKKVMTMKNWTCHFLVGVGCCFYSHQLVEFSFKLCYHQTFCTQSVLAQRHVLGIDSNLVENNLPFPHDLCAIKGISVWPHTFCWHPQQSM